MSHVIASVILLWSIASTGDLPGALPVQAPASTFVGATEVGDAEPAEDVVVGEYSAMPSPLAVELGEHHVEHCDDCLPIEDTTECGRRRFYTFGELLVLQPRRTGLDYAVPDAVDNFAPQGSISTLELETKLGYRVGMGMINRKQTWDVAAVFTYFHSSDQNNAFAPPGGTLYGTLVAPSAIGGEFASAAASTNLNYAIVDVELGRRFSINNGGELRVAVGPRIASIHQKLDANYALGTGNGVLVTSPAEFDGIGLRVVGGATQELVAGFRLFGRAGTSLIAGTSDVRNTQTRFSGQTLVDLSSSTNDVVPVVELAAGLGWSWRFIDLSVGYEVNHWFNLVDCPDVVDFLGNPSKLVWKSSDLNLSGLFARLGIQF